VWNTLDFQKLEEIFCMKMKLTVIGVPLLFALTAAAEDVPRMETFLGYTYVRANSATNVPAFSANGGSGQFVYNFNKWLGVVADLGAVHNGNISGVHLDTTLTNFLLGPRVTLRKGRLAPYFNVLWGGVYASTSTEFTAVLAPGVMPPIYIPGAGSVLENLGEAISTRVVANQTAFAMTAGGGLDIKISRSLSFRPIGIDYYMTRLQNLRSATDNNQNNIRYTAGVNFTFGAK
jgi:hypothetical protein